MRRVQTAELAKSLFVGEEYVASRMEESPMGSALVVRTAYYDRRIGTDVPVFAGAKDALPTVLTARLMVIQVSTSYRLSGMDMRRRIVLNLAIITVAVSVSDAVGSAAKQIWGIAV